jgi:hypothetical protein
MSKITNIPLKEKPEHIKLVKAMGSRDIEISQKAMKIFANLVGPLLKRVIDETNQVDQFYTPLTIGEFEPRTIPLDDYHDVDDADHVRVSFSSKPGSLAYNQLTGADDIPISLFYVSSAIAFYTKYLRAGRLDHASNGIRKSANEFRNILKVQAIQPLLDQLATAQTNDRFHVIRSQTAGRVGLKDFNRLQTLAARIATSKFGGTPPDGTARGITDMIMSPEVVEEIRGMAYQPMNTRPGHEGTAEDTSVGIPAPEEFRQSVYDAAGIPRIYQTNILQWNELGINQDFNVLFNEFAGSNAYPDNAGTGTATFTQGSEELVIAMNRQFTPNGLVKVELRDGETNAVVNTMPDNQFVNREGKVGMWSEAQMGYLALESRNLFGLIV